MAGTIQPVTNRLRLIIITLRKQVIIFFFYLFDEDTGSTVQVPVENVEDLNEQDLEFIYDDKIRKVWHKQEEKWYFSIIDVCQVLTDSENPKNYWNMLKSRLRQEGNEAYTNCVRLKLKASDGKMRLTDCANTEQLLRIIQFIPSRKGEAFKQWLSLQPSQQEDESASTGSLFESIRHVDEYGQEFWYARELQVALEYTEWRNFCKVIDRAKEACKGSENTVSDHFVEVNKMVGIGSGAERELDDIRLSRYACYLIVQNGDPHKKVIALGQTYFAVKTREQELAEAFDDLSEDSKRLATRNEMRIHNKSLAEAANLAGITDPRDYAIFQNKGYQGLYGGLGRKEIQNRKGLKDSQNILDYMGSTELAANLFRATQTDEKIRREKITGKDAANKTHFEVGKKVRQTIKDLGGTMPENLPTPERSIRQLEREERKKLK